jgi:hypothetical protein
VVLKEDQMGNIERRIYADFGTTPLNLPRRYVVSLAEHPGMGYLVLLSQRGTRARKADNAGLDTGVHAWNGIHGIFVDKSKMAILPSWAKVFQKGP